MRFPSKLAANRPPELRRQSFGRQPRSPRRVGDATPRVATSLSQIRSLPRLVIARKRTMRTKLAWVLGKLCTGRYATMG